MGNFIDHRIAQRVSKEFRRVAQGRTTITPLDNGDEVRNAKWRYKKLQFSASFALLSPQAQEEVTSAFWACNAQLLLFRFRDHGDFQVERSPLIVDVAERTPVQLTKRYTFGSAFADRIIQAVDSCEIYDDNGDQVSGVLDDALGLFTPDDPWGSDDYTWSGRFSVWVRFGSDELDMTLHHIDIATADVELHEQKARR